MNYRKKSNNVSMEIAYKPRFIRQFGKLVPDLQEEVESTIELLRDRENYKRLKVHKLHGPLAGCYSCSVNYNYRIVFIYEGTDQVILLAVGDHDVYR